MTSLPTTTRVVVVKRAPATQKPVYHAAVLETRPIPKLKAGQVLVKINAVGFNHRDVWIRKGQYPNINFGGVFGSDGAGTVIASSQPTDPLLHKRVFLVPMRGWESHPDAPESEFGILGGVTHPSLGTFSEHVVVSRDQVIPSPDHLDDVHVAAWPLGGVTAWRAAIINASVLPAHNVLITGAGGGVALLALQLCIAQGANVYVTSGSEEKIRKAKELGARGGVCYKEKDWPKKLHDLLGSSTPERPYLDSVIDSAGGDILKNQVGKFLKQGGRVVCYGMTASPKISFTMKTVLANQKLIGSTMGSHADLLAATEFISKHRIVPVVSHVFEGLERVEEGFEVVRRGEQVGKVVVKVGNGYEPHEEGEGKWGKARL